MQTESFAGRLVTALARNSPAFRPVSSPPVNALGKLWSALSRNSSAFTSRPYDDWTWIQWAISKGHPEWATLRRKAVKSTLFPFYLAAGSLAVLVLIAVLVVRLASALPPSVSS
jgi:hypothetical protein